MTYNLYHFLTVEISTRRKSYQTFFQNEYGDLSIPERGADGVPRVRLHVVKELPRPSTTDIVRRLRVKRLFTLTYLIRDLDTDTVDIFFREHWFDTWYLKAISVFAQTQILEPVIYAKLLERGIILLHAAGVSDGTNGFIFTACGGTGKTTLSLNLAREGLQLLGDDLLLVDYRSQTVYPYPRPLHLFSYNIDALHDARIDLRLRSIIRCKDIIRSILEGITGEDFLISTRVPIKRVYPHVRLSKPVPYRKVVLLRSEGANRIVRLDTQDRIASVAGDIIGSFDLNGSLYTNLLEGNEAYIRDTRQRERQAVTEMLRGVGEVSYVNTKSIDMQRIDACLSSLLT